MSAHQFFAEVEAVAEVLDDYVQSFGPDSLFPSAEEEAFTAIWQAVELLSRAYQVLLPLVSYDQARNRLEYAKGYLEIPDPQVVGE